MGGDGAIPRLSVMLLVVVSVVVSAWYSFGSLKSAIVVVCILEISTISIAGKNKSADSTYGCFDYLSLE